MRRLLPLLLLILVGAPPLLRADLMRDLSAADQKKVLAGGQVMTTQDVPGYPWPKTQVYQLVRATPAQVMAVFFDYDNARRYIPNCLESKITRRLSLRSVEVSYLIAVPILADEAYTALNTLSTGPNGSLRVDWKLLKATSILESHGSLVVEPHGQGAILRYSNLVKPSSAAAGLLRGVALGQMRETVQAIVNQAEKLCPAAGSPDMKRLDAALEDRS